MGFEWHSWIGFALALVIALAALAVATMAIKLVTRLLQRRYPSLAGGIACSIKPALAAVAAIALQVVLATSWPLHASQGLMTHLGLILIIVAVASLLSSLVSAAITRLRDRHPVSGDRDQEARRLQTQLSVIRTFLTVAIWLVAVGIALFTIPGAQAAGTSILASAGVASVVVGIAAQSLLGNVFAGLQIAFSGLLRVGDLITVQTQGQVKTGRVEEIVLTAIIINTTEERQLVLPSSYFTTTAYENWTRGSAQLLGTVALDVDWRIDVDAMRSKLKDLLGATELWDGRASNLTVASATGGWVEVQIQVSAADPENLGKLTALVREQMVAWVRSQAADGLPVYRTLSESPQV